MDKYQKEYINVTFGKFFAHVYSLDAKVRYADIEILENVLRIIQNDNILITKYLVIPNMISKYENIIVSYSFDGKQYTPLEKQQVVIDKKEYSVKAFEVDFNNRIKFIKIEAEMNIIDPIIFTIEYIEADKEAYYAKQAQLQKEAVAKKVNARFTLGSDLVNIYFQPCNDSYSYSQIELFVPSETKIERVGGPYGPIDKTTVLTWDIIKKCKVAENDFYLSVSGLAYGKYAFILKQFNTSNTVIYKTDYIEFEIKKPPKPTQQFGQINVI